MFHFGVRVCSSNPKAESHYFRCNLLVADRVIGTFSNSSQTFQTYGNYIPVNPVAR
jgi:hypothetical protein